MKKEFRFNYEILKSLNELPQSEQELIHAAQEAYKSAYAPYSGYRVGAAARLESGTIITGSNQESEVYPAGLCAERTLLFRYFSMATTDKIEVLAIASDPSKNECYPCGICRQTLLDAQRRQCQPFRIIMSGSDSATVVDDAAHLLPFNFTLL